MSKAMILAVDDDAINLEIIDASLEDMDFELRFAGSGNAALALLDDESHRFDAVILDRMMPDLDGLQVLQRIKANPRLADIPVVMQTAAAGSEQVESGLRAGAYYYLTKPYSPTALRSIVSAALENASWRRKLAARVKELDALRFLSSASFVVRTLSEATELAALLATLCPDPAAAYMGLAELLINAVEHGNLAISYREKSRLLQEDRWQREIERRLQLATYKQRRVQVAFERRPGALAFTIADDGEGFDWTPYLEFDPARAVDPNGRGIALAKSRSFIELNYQGAGNVVVALVPRGLE